MLKAAWQVVRDAWEVLPAEEKNMYGQRASAEKDLSSSARANAKLVQKQKAV